MKALPALSLLFLFLTAWAPVELHKYAQWMWSGPGIGAGYRYIIGDLELTVIDLLAMFLAIFLSVLLWAGLARRRAPHALVVRSLYTLASTFLSGVAFYYAVPRGGDIGVGVMVMCVLIPGALVAAAITLVTCITVLTVSLIRGGRPPALPAGLDKVKLIEGKE
jgi:hypothetical protein